MYAVNRELTDPEGRRMIPLITGVAPTPFYRDTSDPSIRPTKLWRRTGQVEVGKTGPGCSVDCRYCNQQSLDVEPAKGRQAGYFFPMDAGVSINTQLFVGSKLDRTLDLDQMFTELAEYPHYDPRGTVILENYNDPGLNWARTLTVMRGLIDNMDHTGPISFITKMAVPRYAVRGMQELQEQGGKPIAIVTYSGMPREIEPPDPRARVEGMRRLHEGGIPVIMSMRPMVNGLNATDERIAETLSATRGLPDIITVGGLFIFPPNPETNDPGTAAQFAGAGYPLPAELTEGAYPNAKTLPDDIRPRIKGVAAQLGIDTPIADHTSCAISRLSTERYGAPMPDRMTYWVGSSPTTVFESSCATYCSPGQMEVCRAKSNEDPTRVIAKAKTALEAIGYPDLDIVQSQTQQGKLLIIGGSLPFEEAITIKQASGWAVSNLPFREAVEHRSRQVLQDELGIGFDKTYAGAILVGEEWHVFVNGGNLDGVNNELVTRWLRHQNRARIQVMNTEELLGDGVQTVTDQLVEKTFGIQTRAEIEAEVSNIASGIANLQ